MSFNIKRHISTSVISWWLGHTCYLDSVKSEFLDRCERHGSRPISENVNFHTCWSGNWTCPIPKKKRICTSVVVDVGTCPDFRKSELAGLLLVCWGGGRPAVGNPEDSLGFKAKDELTFLQFLLSSWLLQYFRIVIVAGNGPEIFKKS